MPPVASFCATAWVNLVANRTPSLNVPRSPRADDSARAFDLIQAISLEAPPPSPATLQGWDHGNASYWLRASQPDYKALDYNEAKLIVASTICAAEFGVSRSFPKETVYEPVSQLFEAANEQILSLWRGSELRANGSIYEAAAACGVTFHGVSARHAGWGVGSAACPRRAPQAYTDVRIFPSALHLLARKLGAWQVKMVGAQAVMGLGWIPSFLFRFQEKLIWISLAAPPTMAHPKGLGASGRRRKDRARSAAEATQIAQNEEAAAPSAHLAVFFACIH